MLLNINGNRIKLMKELRKSIIEKRDYYLNVELNCVHMSENLRGLTLPEISIITNVTTNTIIYNPHCPGLGGTIVDGKLLFDTVLTSDMQNNDDLMFIVQRNVHLEGLMLDATKVVEENSHLLKNISMDLKIISKILSEGFEIEVTERDVESFN